MLNMNRFRTPALVFALALAIPALAGAQGVMYVTGGNVGIGTDTPSTKLHVKDGDLTVEQSVAATSAVINFKTAASTWEIKQNGNTGRLTFFSPGGGAATASFKFDRQAVENLLRVGVAGPNIVDIAGDLVISGNCTEVNGACADYVFADDYELRSLDELEAFITENKHLPNVPSADEMQEKGVSVTHISGRLLEKIEELTLYTLQQQKTIDALQARLDVLEQ